MVIDGSEPIVQRAEAQGSRKETVLKSRRKRQVGSAEALVTRTLC
ncbi:unnamed protein product [Rhodiola kirilowii]